jgi:hypothetical protein
VRKPVSIASTGAAAGSSKSQPVAADPVASAEDSASAFEDDLCLFDLFGDGPAEGEGPIGGASSTSATPVAGQSTREDTVAVSPEGKEEEEGGLFEGFGSLFEEDEQAAPAAQSEPVTEEAAGEDSSRSFPPDLIRMLSDRGVLSSDDDESFRAVSELFGAGTDTSEGGAERSALLDTAIRKALLRHFAGMGATTATGAIKSPVVTAKKAIAVPVALDKYALARLAGGDHLKLSTKSDKSASSEVTSSDEEKEKEKEEVFVPHTLPLLDGSVVGCLLDRVEGLLHYFVGRAYMGVTKMVG